MVSLIPKKLEHGLRRQATQQMTEETGCGCNERMEISWQCDGGHTQMTVAYVQEDVVALARDLCKNQQDALMPMLTIPDQMMLPGNITAVDLLERFLGRRLRIKELWRSSAGAHGHQDMVRAIYPASATCKRHA